MKMRHRRTSKRKEMGTDKKTTTIAMLAQMITFPLTLVLGANLLGKTTTNCQEFQFLGMSLFLIGWLILLMLFVTGCAIVFDASFAGSLICYIPICFVMLGLGIFALSVSSTGGGKSLSGISYKEYNLSSYSEWLQNKVNDTNKWEKYYKTALVKGDVCSKFTKDYALDTLEKLHSRHLSSLESDCCMPSEECNFNYTSPSIWTKSESQSYSNMDCYAWDNNLNTRCFNCESCKASFVQDVTTQWFWKGIYLVIVSA